MTEATSPASIAPLASRQGRLSDRREAHSIGVHLLEVGLQEDEFVDWRFALIDTVSSKCFWRTHKHSAEAARFAIPTTEEIIIAQRQKAA